MDDLHGVDPRRHIPDHFDDPQRLGRALRELHDALRGFDRDLGGLRDLREGIERLHRQLRPADPREAEEIFTLGTRLDALPEAVFESTLPTQALHGDVSLSSLFHTSKRLIWNDFEDTFRGPAHWDLASFASSLRTRGASPNFVRGMLDAYGWDDQQELAPFIAAQDVYDEIWQMYDRQRRRCHEPRSTLKPVGL